jgi:hypothetical protein
MVTVERSGLTIFRFTCRSAKQLFLAGDFNRWDPAARPMDADAEGAWVARLFLAPGEYQFKYRADDGRWFNDHAAFGMARGPFGWNSTVVVASDAQRDLVLLPPYRRAAAIARSGPPARRTAPGPGEAMTLEQLRAILPAVPCRLASPPACGPA